MKSKNKLKFKRSFIHRLSVTLPSSEDALIDKIWELFVHRSDCYAVQQEDVRYLLVEEPLTKEIIHRHLRGEITIGLYQVSPIDNTVKWALYDLDHGENPTSEDLEKLRKQVVKLYETIVVKKDEADNTHKFSSLAVLIEFSGSKGYHLWIFFDPPIPAIIANKLLRNIMAKTDVLVKEIFPKQGILTGKHYGNLVKLPFGVHRVSKRRTEIYDGTNWNVLDPSYLFKIEPVLTDPQETAALREKIRREETEWMANTYSQGQSYQGEDPPCVKAYLCGGLGPGQRTPAGIQLASYLLNFKGMGETPEKQAEAWQILVDWNTRNCPPHSEEKLRRDMFEQALKGGYDYGCDHPNGVWKARCNLKECSLRRTLLPDLLNELQLSEEEKAEIERILTNPNCEDDISKHLGNVIAGEKDNALGILNLCLSGKLTDPALKQIILLKATEGAGKSTLMRLAGLFKVKDVGRFSAHALDYSDLSGYEILRLKEIGSMDQEAQGVSTIKFLSSDDEGYTVEITSLDEKTRKFKTEQYKIPPITLITSTTRVSLDPQFERRAWTFNPDETEEQTRKIMEWKANYRYQLNEVELELRKETDKDKSWRLLRGLIQTLEPCKVIVPFPKTLFNMLGTVKLRFRGDYEKLMSLVIMNAMLHQRTQPRKYVKGKLIIFSTPEQAVRAIKLVEKPLVSMMTELEERSRNMFEILKTLEIRNIGDVVTKEVRDKIARKLGRSENTVRKYFKEWMDSGYVSSDGKKPCTFTLLTSIQEMETENLRLSGVLKSPDDLVMKMRKELEKCPNVNPSSNPVGEGSPERGTPKVPIADSKLKEGEAPLVERTIEDRGIDKRPIFQGGLDDSTPFKTPLETKKEEEKPKVWDTCSNCGKPIMVGEPRTFLKGLPIHTHCPEGDVRIQKNLVNFTTFLHRREHTCAACLKIGASNRVKAEIYLDEIAALAKRVADELPFLGFDDYFYALLNESVLHELLHMYGAVEEGFCDRITRWALNQKLS